MSERKAPERGTPEWDWWVRGCHDQRNAVEDGMTSEAKQVYDAVQVLAQRGDAQAEIVRWIAVVFTCEWTLRQRLALAWRIVRNR